MDAQQSANNSTTSSSFTTACVNFDRFLSLARSNSRSLSPERELRQMTSSGYRGKKTAPNAPSSTSHDDGHQLAASHRTATTNGTSGHNSSSSGAGVVCTLTSPQDGPYASTQHDFNSKTTDFRFRFAQQWQYGSPYFNPVTNKFYCWNRHPLTLKRRDTYPGIDGVSCDFCGFTHWLPNLKQEEGEEEEKGSDVSKLQASRVDVKEVHFYHCSTCDVDLCPFCLQDVLGDERYHTPCTQCLQCQAFMYSSEAVAHRCTENTEEGNASPHAQQADSLTTKEYMLQELQSAMAPLMRYAAARREQVKQEGMSRVPSHLLASGKSEAAKKEAKTNATAAAALPLTGAALKPPRRIHRKRAEVQAILAKRQARAKEVGAPSVPDATVALTGIQPPQVQRRRYRKRETPQEESPSPVKQEDTHAERTPSPEETPKPRRKYRRRMRAEEESANTAGTQESDTVPPSEDRPKPPRRIHRKRSVVEAILAKRVARAMAERAAALAANAESVPPPIDPMNPPPRRYRKRVKTAEEEESRDATPQPQRRAYRKRLKREEEVVTVKESEDEDTSMEESSTPVAELTPPRRIHRKKSEVKAILAKRTARAAIAAPAAASAVNEVTSKASAPADRIGDGFATSASSAVKAHATANEKKVDRAPLSWQLRMSAFSEEGVAEMSRIEKEMQQKFQKCPIVTETGDALAVCSVQLSTRLSAEKWAERAREVGLFAGIKLC